MPYGATPSRVDRVQKPQGHCPHLGLEADPASIFAGAVEEHRCYAADYPRSIGQGHQATFCLTSEFAACPRYVSPASSPAIARPMAADQGQAGNDSEALEDIVPPPLPRPLFWLMGVLEETSAVKLGVWIAMVVVTGMAVYLSLTQVLGGAALDPAQFSEAAAFISTPTPPAPTATPPPGRRLAVIEPVDSAVGWVSSDDLTDGSRSSNLHVGVLEGLPLHGFVQFSLDSIPPDSRIERATVELVGLSAKTLGAGGTWLLRLLQSEIKVDSSSVNYEQLHSAAVAATIRPELSSEDLAAGQVNVFTFADSQLTELEQRLESGLVTFRLDGPSEGEDNLFTWSAGSDNGGSSPVLRVIYQPPPTATPMVVTATPTPANVLTVAARAVTATYQATVVGTATPGPRHVVTATPPLVVTNTPTPGNTATAGVAAAESTAVAFLFGTPTPLPAGFRTATPDSPPLLIPLDQIYQVTPALVETPTPIPTPTSTALPPSLRGKIAFVSDRLGEPAVFVVDPDDSRIALLTDRWAYDRARELDALSPDSARRLFVKGFRNNYEIWVQDTADGLTSYLVGGIKGGQTVFDPAWSPNGVAIAFVAQMGTNTEIFVLDTETPTPAGDVVVNVDVLNLRDGPGADYDIVGQLSSGDSLTVTGRNPEGDWLAVRTADGMEGWVAAGLTTAAADAGRADNTAARSEAQAGIRLTSNQWEQDRHPSWSPDGTRIVFWSDRETSRRQIWVMDADGSDQRPLVQDEWNNWDPVWLK